jgi:hypothetical protein
MRIASCLVVSSLTIAGVVTSIGLDAHATTAAENTLKIPPRIMQLARVEITAS